MTGEAIEFDVRGTPVPQGNMRAFVVGGVARVSHKGPKDLQAWRNLVAVQAQAFAPTPIWGGPVRLELYFTLQRPKSEPTHRGRGKKRVPVVTMPDRKPDLDKLVRAVGDALAGVIFEDDARIVEIQAAKTWGDPGVRIRVLRLGP
jgi:crossover junction endodeoxyribonuclease RusA